MTPKQRKFRWLVLVLSALLFFGATFGCTGPARVAVQEAATDSILPGATTFAVMLAGFDPFVGALVVFSVHWVGAFQAWRVRRSELEERHQVDELAPTDCSVAGRRGLWGFLDRFRLVFQLIGAAGAAWSSLGLGFGTWAKARADRLLTRVRRRGKV